MVKDITTYVSDNFIYKKTIIKKNETAQTSLISWEKSSKDGPKRNFQFSKGVYISPDKAQAFLENQLDPLDIIGKDSVYHEKNGRILYYDFLKNKYELSGVITEIQKISPEIKR
jgi:hypothetical protein